MKKVTSSGHNQSDAACSSTDRPDRFANVTMPEILRDDPAHRQLLETGSELMLQQHLAYNGYLTASEQTRWKNTITNALADKSVNDASNYLLDKLREPLRSKMIKYLWENMETFQRRKRPYALWQVRASGCTCGFKPALDHPWCTSCRVFVLTGYLVGSSKQGLAFSFLSLIL